jgi:two-component system, NtrC family, sensor histidine kinase GlrK
LQFTRPRSLSGLIVLGFLLISLPLLAGVVSASFQMSSLSQRSERLVTHGVQGTQLSQALVQQIAAMERSARLYQVLGLADVLTAFHDNHDRMQAALDGMEALPGDEARTGLTQSIRDISASISRGLDTGEQASIDEALAQFGQLSEAAGELSLFAGRQIDRELRSVQSATDKARQRLLLQTIALVPISLALTIAFGVLLGRPLRDIDSAISELGHGRLDTPVHVRGPTDLRALGQQIEWLRVRLQEVSEDRARFLRHVSHELKTPLATLLEGAELLVDGSVGPLTKEQAEVADIVRENSLRLQRLIENLLSYTAWQSQVGELSVSKFSLARLAESVVDNYRLTLASAGIQLQWEVEDLEVEADYGKLRLVIDNLLSNAIKFSPDDATLLVRTRAKPDDRFSIEIADSGPGVAAADRPRIFDAFYQGEASAGGYLRGTGIGLSIVREFVAAHGGSVELLDGDLPGALFRVDLPIHQPRDRRNALQTASLLQQAKE